MTFVKSSAWMGGLVALMLALGVQAQAQEAKIGYVDVQKAIQETSAGKKAKKELEKEYNAKKAELEKKEADLKKMDEDLKKKAVALSDDVRNKKVQEFQQEMLKFQREVGESQMKIQKREKDLTEPILEKIKTAIEKVGKDGGYTMVLERNENVLGTVLWAKKDADLTDAVVKEVEKNTK